MLDTTEVPPRRSARDVQAPALASVVDT